MRRYGLFLLFSTAALLVACHSKPAQSTAPRTTDEGAAAWGGAPKAASTQAVARTKTMKPEWQQLGTYDAKLADQGRQLFASKGCIGCHNVGFGRKVGPDLAIVTSDVTPDWATSMIEHPGHQLATDSHAKKLLAKYLTPMTNQHVAPQEVRAILEFFRGYAMGKQKPVGKKF